MSGEEWMAVIRALDSAGCFVVFGLLTAYMAKMMLPTMERIIDSHDKRIEQLINLIKAIDKKSENG